MIVESPSQIQPHFNRVGAAVVLLLSYFTRQLRGGSESWSVILSAKVCLILNRAVLLRDGKPGYKFDFPRGKVVGDRVGSPKDRYVNARLDYVNQ
jgi:hypothetical protein